MWFLTSYSVSLALSLSFLSLSLSSLPLPPQENNGAAPYSVLPEVVGHGHGQRVQCELQASRPDHGWPQHAIRPELAQWPGGAEHTFMSHKSRVRAVPFKKRLTSILTHSKMTNIPRPDGFLTMLTGLGGDSVFTITHPSKAVLTQCLVFILRSWTCSGT